MSLEPDSARRVYEGRLLGLTVEQWGANEREIVEHPGAVAMVAVDAEGYVTLVRQLRSRRGNICSSCRPEPPSRARSRSRPRSESCRRSAA